MMKLFLLSLTVLVLFGATASAQAEEEEFPTPDLGSTLSNMRWEDIIGGPLRAVIGAQAQSSIAAADFISQVGFAQNETSGVRSLVMIEFAFDDTNDINAEGEPVSKRLSLPFMTMLPIPYLQVTYYRMDFNVFLRDSTTRSVTSSYRVNENDDSSTDRNAYQQWGRASTFRGEVTSRSSTGTSNRFQQYSMNLQVEARGTELPAGTARVLEIMESLVSVRNSNSS